MLSDSPGPILGGVDMKEMKAAPPAQTGSKFNTFVMGNVVLGQNFSDQSASVPHTDDTTGNVTLGADYRITPHLRAGALFGYTHTDASINSNGSKATIDSYSPGLYASFADNGWYVNAVASYGFNNYTEDREVSFGGGSADAHSRRRRPNRGHLDGGYDFHAGAFTYGPLAGIQYAHVDVNGFTEDGAQSLGADETVAKQETDSLRSRLGGTVSYLFQFGSFVLTPHLSASWQHEFMDGSRGIDAQNRRCLRRTVFGPDPQSQPRFGAD